MVKFFGLYFLWVLKLIENLIFSDLTDIKWTQLKIIYSFN